MKHFINVADFSSADILAIIDRADSLKLANEQPLADKVIGMIFEKPSTRTRISFDIAIKQLGGSSIILNPEGIHYGKGNESIKDTSKVLSEYSDIIMIRTSNHKNLEEFALHSEVPIINGLSEQSHPCQIMSDILTFEELKGEIKGKTIAWLGDGNNNMSNSLIEAASKFDFKLNIGCPKKYSPNKKILKWASENHTNIKISKDPKDAIKDADCVMTDKWISMNDKVNKKAKKKILEKYQVNKKLMKYAKNNAIFMHCLPVGRGEEVTDEIIDGNQSVVWTQALNRVHAQKSIITWCLN